MTSVTILRLTGGSVLLCLALFASGCANSPTLAIPPRGEHLLILTPYPECLGRAQTNGEMFDCLAAYRRALEECNADKKAANTE